VAPVTAGTLDGMGRLLQSGSNQRLGNHGLGNRRLGSALAVGAVLVAVVAGCGDEGGDVSSKGTEPTASASPTSNPSASATDQPADLPGCARVWRVGERLPGGYDGCAENGKAVEADVLRCSSGQALVRYADRYYAVKGGEIRKASGPLKKDQTYLDHAVACRG
jgi:hypothetical protein